MSLTTPSARPFAALACAVLLAGCANPQNSGWQTANLVDEVPVTKAFISPPPGGPMPLTVLERRYQNGVAQDIVLENGSGAAGQNVIIVRAYGPMGLQARRGNLPQDRASLERIRRELREQFPNVRMQISGLYVQNKYGPFGYATGRPHSGGACVYAWQRIAAEERVFSFQRGAITWRLRVCDRHSTARDLLFLAYGLTINGYFLAEWWNPYGEAPAPDPDIGVLGRPMLPEQVVSPTSIAPPRSFGERRRATVAAPSRRSAAPAPRQAPVATNRPLPGAAVVPRPENVDLREPVPERTPPAAFRETPGGPTVIVPTPPSPGANGTITPPPGGTTLAPAPAAPPTTIPPPPGGGGALAPPAGRAPAPSPSGALRPAPGGGGAVPSLAPAPSATAAPAPTAAPRTGGATIRVVGTPRAAQ